MLGEPPGTLICHWQPQSEWIQRRRHLCSEVELQHSSQRQPSDAFKPLFGHVWWVSLLSSERTVGKLSLRICDLESANLLTSQVGRQLPVWLVSLGAAGEGVPPFSKILLCSFKTWNIDKYAGGAPRSGLSADGTCAVRGASVFITAPLAAVWCLQAFVWTCLVSVLTEFQTHSWEIITSDMWLRVRQPADFPGWEATPSLTCVPWSRRRRSTSILKNFALFLQDLEHWQVCWGSPPESSSVTGMRVDWAPTAPVRCSGASVFITAPLAAVWCLQAFVWTCLVSVLTEFRTHSWEIITWDMWLRVLQPAGFPGWEATPNSDLCAYEKEYLHSQKISALFLQHLAAAGGTFSFVPGSSLVISASHESEDSRFLSLSGTNKPLSWQNFTQPRTQNWEIIP